MIKIFSKIAAGWKKFALIMARFNTFLLMTVIYFVIVPFFSLMRFADPLKLKFKKNSNSYWQDKQPLDTTLEGMSRNY